MVSCFHTHLKNKLDDHGKEKCEVFQQDHSKLDTVAFKGLTGKKQQKIVWDKNELCNQIGQDFYEHYKQIGILVEEDVLELHDKPGVSAEEHVQSKTQVRFYHKLFCEWYAAHRLSQFTVSTCKCKVYNTLKHIDPFDLQYVYRFACGLNTSAADTIIKYLRRDTKTFENFVILCILEKSGSTEEIKDAVRDFCSKNIRLRHSHSSILLWSTIQLLQIASTNKVRFRFILLCPDLRNSESGKKIALQISKIE
ncbi:hypothetical protein HOLleu_39306 [Holothuria leucospilota]|uniref:Uncharacterized protein n=1 Tax=Holothuria leucospilota TaxID=206669 RepID=A0A9Q0YG06_HOLLE|nr:hypothetical protein HOLleu_39306 [Holothuria leucospilota]